MTDVHQPLKTRLFTVKNTSLRKFRFIIYKLYLYLSIGFSECSRMQFVSHIIETEIYRSLLYFVLGGLFVLFTYHLFRFFSNHSIAYLYYSLYALFSLLAYLSVLENGFIKDLLSDTLVSRLSKEYFTSVYN